MGNNAHGFLLAKDQIGGKMSCDIRRSALLTWILIVICMIVFCGSAAYLLLYGQNKISAEKEFNQMRNSFRDLSGLYAQNSDLVGWIRVDGTRIDYPVMQTPDNPEYYLHRDFNKEYSDSGTPFLDANSRIGGTWNWIIYGHNMKFGTMFHDLQKYDSKEFWDTHKTFSVDVYDPETGIIDPEVYEIFAVCRSRIRAGNSDAFSYYRYAGCTDEDTFHEYVAGVRSESIYETDIIPQYGEQLVTLSTCAYHTNEGRFYVVGRRIL